ncbi:MAG: glycosyltransferase [Flavobacteriales bacterium]|nr:glycosyltransferase [Flavobacteriales bacterium]
MTTSVALCTFNGEKFLQEQLDSILSQDIPVNEIVICDDGSTDSTQLILKEYESRFPTLFCVFINSENLGYVRNFEKALSLCTQEIIFLCDQDDMWHQDKVNIITQYFTQHPETGIVAHNLELIGSYNGNKTFWDLKNFCYKEQKFQQKDLLQRILIDGNIFPGMSLAIRKNLLNQYLPLQKVNTVIIHDYEIIIKGLRDEKFGLIQNTLSGYRQHDGQSVGYKDGDSTAQNNLEEIHLASKQYLHIKNYISIFNLNENIAVQFKAEIQAKYSLFLAQFPFLKKIFIHLKNKYYYKIIHF